VCILALLLVVWALWSVPGASTTAGRTRTAPRLGSLLSRSSLVSVAGRGTGRAEHGGLGGRRIQSG
jgi:hypothetical protein